MTSNPRGHQVIQLSIAVCVIDTVAVAVRFLARWSTKAKLALDDWLIVASLVPFYGMITSSWLRMYPEIACFAAFVAPFERRLPDVMSPSRYQRRIRKTNGIPDGARGYNVDESKNPAVPELCDLTYLL